MDPSELPEVLRQWANSRASEMWTAGPAVVKSYDAATQTADLELVVRAPLVRDEDSEDVTHEALPVIPNVRIAFPSATGVGITFPIAPGDEVLFIVSTLQLSEYRRTGKTSDAVDVRRNSLGCGGWAIPCALKDAALLPQASTDALVLEHPTEIRIGKDAVKKIGRDDLIEAELAAIKTALESHVHSGVTTGPGSTGTAAPSYSPGSVGATKGRVE